MPVNRNQIKPALVEIILVVTLLNAFAIYKLYRKVDSLAAHTAALSSQSAPAPKVDVSIDDDEFVGDPNAPVTIIEFTDYQCSLCRRHFEQTYPQIHEKYIETGIARLVVRDFPIDFHRQAQKAAEAAECAGEQGNYWEMHYMLFENQANLSIDNYKEWAREIGLDGARFDQCLDSGAMAEEIKIDVADGISYGVRGTPVFFINGKMLSGAKPFAEFDAAIQKALEE
jgi:protein-disulfide isomerase